MAEGVDKCRPDVLWRSDFLLTEAIREGLQHAEEGVEHLTLKNVA